MFDNESKFYIFNLCKSPLSCLDLPLTQFLFVLVRWVLKRTARILFIVLGFHERRKLKSLRKMPSSSWVGKYVFESIVHWFVSFIRLIGVSETNESNRKWGVERAYFQDRHGSHHLHRVGIFAQSSEKNRIFLFLIHTNGGPSVVHLEYVDWKIKWKIK